MNSKQYDFETTVFTKKNISKEKAKSNIRHSHPKVLFEYLEVLYHNQTHDEQSTNSTKEDNGIGFNKSDARRMTKIHKKLTSVGKITPDDLNYLRKHLPKYWTQLI